MGSTALLSPEATTLCLAVCKLNNKSLIACRPVQVRVEVDGFLLRFAFSVVWVDINLSLVVVERKADFPAIKELHASVQNEDRSSFPLLGHATLSLRSLIVAPNTQAHIL